MFGVSVIKRKLRLLHTHAVLSASLMKVYTKRFDMMNITTKSQALNAIKIV